MRHLILLTLLTLTSCSYFLANPQEAQKVEKEVFNEAEQATSWYTGLFSSSNDHATE